MEATSQTIVFVLLFQLFVKNSESRVGGVGMHCASSDNAWKGVALQLYQHW